MKIITLVSRLFVGLLFIFSGFIKLNDPTGFSIKLNEYFDVFATDLSAKQDTLSITVQEAGEVMASRANVLYHFDESKALEFNTDISKVTDSSHGAFGQFRVSAYCVLDNDNFFSNEYYFADSSQAASVLVTIKAGTKNVLSRDFKISPSNPIAHTQEVDVKSFVKTDNFLVGWFRSWKSYTVGLSIFICVFEIALGFALLIGWMPVLTIWLLLLMIVFFTFLTWYSWQYNKVTDCGCFGDFIKLKPFESFMKDLILLVFILLLFFRRKHISAFFSKPFAWKFVTTITALSTGLAIYCYYYLPIFDFLPFKVGNEIRSQMVVPPGERATDSVSMFFVMRKGDDSAAFTLKQWDSVRKEGWEYVRRKQEIIIPAYKPPIHDFQVSDAETGAALLDSLLDSKGYKLVFVYNSLEKSRTKAQNKLNALAAEWTRAGYALWALTGTDPAGQKAYRQEHQVPYRFFNTDGTTLKMMVRSNPGVMLLNGSTVVAKWSACAVPDLKKVQKQMR
jgi:uncharacterized membrane protein YphA (DoxX/SURF4 family)